MNKSRLGRTLTGQLRHRSLMRYYVAGMSDRCSHYPFCMDEVSSHCVCTDRHRWNHGRLNELVSMVFTPVGGMVVRD